MIQKKALFLGCSFTAGQELRYPKKQAYPYVWGEMNNFQVVNKALLGGSNDSIIRIVFEEVKNNYDLIVIAWTLVTRKEWFDIKINKPVNVSVSHDRGLPHCKSFFKLNFSMPYEEIRLLTNIIMLQSFFKQINQKYIFLNTFDLLPETKNSDLVKFIDLSNYIDFSSSMSSWTKHCKYGPDSHPLDEGHIITANKLHNFLTETE